MLRVGNVGSEQALEAVRDALDRLGVDYEFVRADPDEDRFPQTAYFYVPDESTDDVETAMRELFKEYGIDAETL
jgi:hypothetical protein